MQRKTAEKTANLLSAVATTLTRCGRPRMRPGLPRPLAVTWWGSPVRPTHPNAIQWSLPGAVIADAKALGYGANIRRYAIEAILDAREDWHSRYAIHLEDLDTDTYDTREIIRRVKAAQKKIEAELKQGATA